MISYRTALMSSFIESAEVEVWPVVSMRWTLASLSFYRRKKKGRTLEEEKAEEKGREEGSDWGGGGGMEEYELQQAVAVRTRRSAGRKRKTEAGKRRMAAKLVARSAPRRAREAGEVEDGVEMW